MSEGVEGRVVIITGGAGGIGRGLAHYLGTHGASVAITDWRAEAVDVALDELREASVDVLGVTCDVQDRSAMFAMVDQVVERFGKVDAIVNNAQAFGTPQALTSLAEEEFDLIYGSGVKGTLWGMQAVHPIMQAAGWGRIVNVASSAGRAGQSGFGAYNAAKEGIRALTRTAAREWATEGITVNCYCPAAAVKRGVEGKILNEYQQQGIDMLMNFHPTKRWGDPSADIGPVVAFLCSDGSRYMTGETLMVDGGGFMWS